MASWDNTSSVSLGSTFNGTSGVVGRAFAFTREDLRVWVGEGGRAEDLAGDRLLVLAAAGLADLSADA